MTGGPLSRKQIIDWSSIFVVPLLVQLLLAWAIARFDLNERNVDISVIIEGTACYS